MSEPSREHEAWRRVGQGLGFARRGIVLVASAGLGILLLGALGRAGCSDPALPEVRSLMWYQDILFHMALWLGFTLVTGGLLWASCLPAPPRVRWLVAGSGGMTGAALLLASGVARPGQLPPVNGPPGDAAVLAAAVVGTAALSTAAMVAMLVARRLGSRFLPRGVALLGPALLFAAGANAEAASGILFPAPMSALYAVGAVAVVNAAIGLWLVRILRDSEGMIRRHLEEPPASP